jgi:electron-transferring-flavoprotein dehydrogenase
MGTTSAFHEGGDHVAIRSGKIAGRLAALGALRAYNGEWQRAIGDEVLRNVAFAELVHDFGPDDWDRVFGLVDSVSTRGARYAVDDVATTGLYGLRLFLAYKWTKFRYRDGGYCQIREDDYAV